MRTVIIKSYFEDFLEEFQLNERRNLIFQRDGARSHKTRIVLELLTIQLRVQQVV